MAYAPPIDRGHMTWLMKQIEARCSNPDKANLGRIRGSLDLQLVVMTAPEDREAVDREFLVDMTKAMRERTGLESVIYLDGDEPEIVRNPVIY